MASRRVSRTVLAGGLCAVMIGVTLSLLGPHRADACGGFFCQQVPIDQAGEQIIFRQDGDQVTAVVLIQYVGTAEDFSWVVPVAGVPELSVGSDLAFAPLELATRPQFTLEVNGSACPSPGVDFNFPGAPSDDSAGGDADGGVNVLEQLTVGPFDVQVVTSDDPDAMATWLMDNGYDLTDRGRDLIEPYVTMGLNFVALRLRQDQGVGDIQPLIMRYQGTIPTIPIRLTTVAAQPDMGVLVWLLGPARAVPLNYLHVVPNYTLLNWYAGSTNAYASYQGLITAAMNEAGGQGFATDYAGRDLDPLSLVPTVESLQQELTRLAAVAGDAEFVAALANGFVFPQDKVLEILHRELPLPAGQGDFIYTVDELVAQAFTADALAAARANITTELQTTQIDTLEETLAVFDGDPYLTRMYTTLSADEMTLDPAFSFNPDLGDQSIERKATLDIACSLGSTSWTLTLGPGTDRDGEVVIEGTGEPPSFVAPTIEQDSVWQTATATISGPFSVLDQKQFDVARVFGTETGGLGCGNGTAGCGAGTAGMLLMTVIGLRFMRRRRRGE